VCPWKPPFETPIRITILAILLPPLFSACGGAASDETSVVIGAVIHHCIASEAKCERYEQGGICREQGHWIVEIQGKRFTDPEKLSEVIKREADAERTDKKMPHESQRHVLIRAEPTSPWSVCQSVIRPCAKAGIYKLELSSAKPGEKKGSVECWLPRDSRGPQIQRLYIRLFVHWDPARGVVKRKIDARDYVSEDLHKGGQELMKLMEAMAEEQKADKISCLIHIDAGPDVPFEAVVNVTSLCKENNFDRVYTDPYN